MSKEDLSATQIRQMTAQIEMLRGVLELMAATVQLALVACPAPEPPWDDIKLPTAPGRAEDDAE